MTRTNKICTLISIAIVLICVSIIVSHVHAQSTQPRPRFEVLYVEDYSSYSNTRLGEIEVIHDKETGQEVVCYFKNAQGISCVPTGRSWSGN